jgi:hypothetical protein
MGVSFRSTPPVSSYNPTHPKMSPNPYIRHPSLTTSVSLAPLLRPGYLVNYWSPPFLYILRRSILRVDHYLESMAVKPLHVRPVGPHRFSPGNILPTASASLRRRSPFSFSEGTLLVVP